MEILGYIVLAAGIVAFLMATTGIGTGKLKDIVCRVKERF